MNFVKLLPVVGLLAIAHTGTVHAKDTTPVTYQRIVSGTGNASEILHLLGLTDKLVAVDDTSLLPADVMKKKPKIGYRRRLSSEGILSMQPDLLIIAPDAGPEAVLEQIKAADVNTITMPNVKSIDGVIADVKFVAKAVNHMDAAQPMLDKLNADKTYITDKVKAYPQTPKIAFLMDAGKKKLMGLGKGTAGSQMIAVVGGENVFLEKFKSVKTVSEEAMIESDADMIIIAAHGNKNAQADSLVNAVEHYPNLALTNAAEKKCVFRISTIKALGFGPTFTEAAKQIVDAVPSCVTASD